METCFGELGRAADEAGIDPGRISFTRVRDAVRGRLSDPGAFSPDSLDDLVAALVFEITCQRSLN